MTNVEKIIFHLGVEGHFGAAVTAPPIQRWTTRRQTFRRRFLIFIYFLSYEEKSNEAGDFLNAVEREPAETRVLNPTASEASYKPKQRSYRTTNLKKNVLAPNSPGAEMSGAEMSSAETAAPSRRRRNVPDPVLVPSASKLSCILSIVLVPC